MIPKKENRFEGIYVATICPMHKDGSIDEEGLIVAKFEAYTTVDELEAALVTVLATN